jgi:hypothetical protein
MTWPTSIIAAYPGGFGYVRRSCNCNRMRSEIRIWFSTGTHAQIDATLDALQYDRVNMFIMATFMHDTIINTIMAHLRGILF